MSQTPLPEGEDKIPTRPNSPMNEEGPPEFDVLLRSLQESPLDPGGWQRLVEIAEASGEIDKIRAVYDGLLKHYPNTSSAQIAYISHFLHDPKTFAQAEELFKRYLRASPSVDLWDFYLTYVRRVNTGPQTREVVRKSFEFALDYVGQDKASGTIWSDYIKFLKDAPASSTWEEQQKMDALRKVYHRAVQIPLENVESLWQELESFETSLNKTTAKKFMADLSPSYIQARSALRQLTSQHLPGLYPTPSHNPSGRPDLFLPPVPDFDPSDRQLVSKWKAYLKWEMDNPLALEDKDKATFNTRVQLAFRKAVIRMRFFPEIWFMAYTWTTGIGKSDEALTLLKQGMEANPLSALLHFTFAEVQELKKDYTAVHNMYDQFLVALRKELDGIQTTIDSANSSFSSDLGDLNGKPANGIEPAPSGIVEVPSNMSLMSQTSADIPTKATELTERRTEYGLVWIMYIRFAQRAEGIKASRSVFGKARKDTKWTPWEVYEAAALLEYHNSDQGTEVARKIFDKGMELFGQEVHFVERHLGFLISINDKNNARALFERVIGTFPSDKARPLWERWSRFEYQNSDLEASLKLEKRIADAYPHETAIKRFAQRHTYLGTDAIASRDLGFSQAKKAAFSNKTKTSISKEPSMFTAAPTSSNKRQPSPESRKARDGPEPAKRARASSPPARDDRDHRWRRRSPPPRRDREDDKPSIQIPSVLSSFIGQLPPPSVFDGPVFRTEDLMNVFRNAVIPSANRARSPPPIPSPRGRPPPEYGYQPAPPMRGGRRY